MKRQLGILMLCVCLTVMAIPFPAKAAEKGQATRTITTFSNLAEDKPVYALIYNTYEYQIRKNPGFKEPVVTVPSGQQITLLECVSVGNKLWFLCETAVNDKVYRGYVEQEYVISGDQNYNEWLSTLNTKYKDIVVYESEAGSAAVGKDAFADYVTKNFPYDYRQALIELHQKHPNWNFVPFNTNLDWKTVIDNEMVPARNLIYITAKDEWKSKAPGDYDPVTGKYIGKSGPNWVQASREAVEYFMNPSYFLDEKSVFMFEQLTYDTGAHVQSGVEAILQGTWMNNKPLEDGSWGTYSAAFMEIAVRTGVSPYHLASRVRLEQGAAGTSKLISGTVPGYEGYYNYFNVKASGATTDEIIKNGLNYAKSKGWNSRFAALLGGSQVISDGYISKGQDTLYLQKFDVDASYNGLYSHQYMQNVQAPYTEGRKVYDAYNAIGNIENSFVFKIPVYKNMGVYSGDINSELKSFALDQNNQGKYYLKGEIVVVEWVDGISTVPPVKPIMYFESADGKEKIDVFVTPTGTNTYYFDRFIDGLTPGKQYIFKVESGSDKNISTKKGMTLLLGNSSLPGSAKLGRIGEQVLSYETDSQGRMIIKSEEYKYSGDINSELMSFALKKNDKGATYLTGEIVVVEWVDGVSTVPPVPPVMKFKSAKGEEIPVFVTATGTNTYYFDRFIENLTPDVEYYFEVSSGAANNTSAHKSMKVNLDTSPNMAPSAVLGELGENTLVYEKNVAGEMVIRCKSKNYIGDINSQLNSILGKNVGGTDYISGEIIIVEWVNGVSTVPSALPLMRMMSADGLENMEVFVTPTGTNTYYFDRSFGCLRPGTEYRLKVESGSSWNHSDKKSMIVPGNASLQPGGLLCETAEQSVWYKVSQATGELIIFATDKAKESRMNLDEPDTVSGNDLVETDK